MEQAETQVGSGEATHDASAVESHHSTPESSVPAAVADKFAAVFGSGESGASAGEAQATAQSEADQSQADELEESRLAKERANTQPPADGSQPTPVPTKVKTAVAPKAGNEEATATLDPVLRHAAQRAGWSEEDIAEALSVNPEAATRAFTKLQQSYNDLSERYAQFGTQRLQQQPAAPAAAANAPAATDPFAALDELFKADALQKFAENNGEELVEKFMKPLYAAIAPIKDIQARYEAQQRDALAKQVTGIFTGWEGDFADLYGKGTDLTPDQLDARQRVGQLADQIIDGASRQGIDLPVDEALERAHAYMTRDRVAETARKQVVNAVKGRANAITARPTQRKAGRTVGDGASRGDEAATNAVSSFWAERGR